MKSVPIEGTKAIERSHVIGTRRREEILEACKTFVLPAYVAIRDSSRLEQGHGANEVSDPETLRDATARSIKPVAHRRYTAEHWGIVPHAK